tara:strand:- start:94 stop:378 length:285 start_codon:yes stop_codon:yes gene_type:complete
MSSEAWKNESYPDEQGWTRKKFIRGSHTKNPDKPYYVFYSPDGVRFRSIVKVNEYIEKHKEKIINITIANVPNTKVNITINNSGGTHIRWLDNH